MKDAHALNLILMKIMNLNQTRNDDTNVNRSFLMDIHEPSASIRNGLAPVRGLDGYEHVQFMYQSGFYLVRELFLFIVGHEFNRYPAAYFTILFS